MWIWRRRRQRQRRQALMGPAAGASLHVLFRQRQGLFAPLAACRSDDRTGESITCRFLGRRLPCWVVRVACTVRHGVNTSWCRLLCLVSAARGTGISQQATQQQSEHQAFRLRVSCIPHLLHPRLFLSRWSRPKRCDSPLRRFFVVAHGRSLLTRPTRCLLGIPASWERGASHRLAIW